jgi:hypothetical protein
MYTAFMSLSIGSRCGLLRTRKWNICFHKMRVFLLTKWLASSQERLSYILKQVAESSGWIIRRYCTSRKLLFYASNVGAESLTTQWHEFLYPLSIQISVLFIQWLLHCWFHIVNLSRNIPVLDSYISTSLFFPSYEFKLCNITVSSTSVD